MLQSNMSFNKAVQSIAALKLHNYAMRRRQNLNQKIKLMKEIRSLEREHNQDFEVAKKEYDSKVIAAWKIRYYVEYLRLISTQHIVNIVEEKNQGLEQQNANLKTTNNTLKHELDEIKSMLDKHGVNAKQIKDEKRLLQQQLENTQIELESTKSELQRQLELLHRAKTDIQQGQVSQQEDLAKMDVLRSELNITRLTCQEMVKNNAQKDSEIDVLKGKIEELLRLQQVAKAEMEEMEANHFATLQQEQDKYVDLEHRLSDKLGLEAEIHQREDTIASLRSEIEELHQVIEQEKSKVEESEYLLEQEKDKVKHANIEKDSVQRVMTDLAIQLQNTQDELAAEILKGQQKEQEYQELQTAMDEKQQQMEEVDVGLQEANQEIDFLVAENEELAREIECYTMKGEELEERHRLLQVNHNRVTEYMRFLEEELFIARRAPGNNKPGATYHIPTQILDLEGRPVMSGMESSGHGGRVSSAISGSRGGHGDDSIDRPTTDGGQFLTEFLEQKERGISSRLASASLREGSAEMPISSATEEKLASLVSAFEEKISSMDKAANSLKILVEKAESLERIQVNRRNTIQQQKPNQTVTSPPPSSAQGSRPPTVQEEAEHEEDHTEVAHVNSKPSSKAEEKKPLSAAKEAERLSFVEEYNMLEQAYYEIQNSIVEIRNELLRQKEDIKQLQDIRNKCKSDINLWKKSFKKQFGRDATEEEKQAELSEYLEQMAILREQINVYKASNLTLNAKAVALNTELEQLYVELEESGKEYERLFGGKISDVSANKLDLSRMQVDIPVTSFQDEPTSRPGSQLDDRVASTKASFVGMNMVEAAIGGALSNMAKSSKVSVEEVAPAPKSKPTTPQKSKPTTPHSLPITEVQPEPVEAQTISKVNSKDDALSKVNSKEQALTKVNSTEQQLSKANSKEHELLKVHSTEQEIINEKEVEVAPEVQTQEEEPAVEAPKKISSTPNIAQAAEGIYPIQEGADEVNSAVSARLMPSEIESMKNQSEAPIPTEVVVPVEVQDKVLSPDEKSVKGKSSKSKKEKKDKKEKKNKKSKSKKGADLVSDAESVASSHAEVAEDSPVFLVKGSALDEDASPHRSRPDIHSTTPKHVEKSDSVSTLSMGSAHRLSEKNMVNATLLTNALMNHAEQAKDSNDAKVPAKTESRKTTEGNNKKDSPADVVEGDNIPSNPDQVPEGLNGGQDYYQDDQQWAQEQNEINPAWNENPYQQYGNNANPYMQGYPPGMEQYFGSMPVMSPFDPRFMMMLMSQQMMMMQQQQQLSPSGQNNNPFAFPWMTPSQQIQQSSLTNESMLASTSNEAEPNPASLEATTEEKLENKAEIPSVQQEAVATAEPSSTNVDLSKTAPEMAKKIIPLTVDDSPLTSNMLSATMPISQPVTIESPVGSGAPRVLGRNPLKGLKSQQHQKRSQNHQANQLAREKIAKLKGEMEQYLALVLGAKEEIDVLEATRADVREDILTWHIQFYDVSGYVAEESDKTRSKVYPSLIAAFMDAQSELRQKYADSHPLVVDAKLKLHELVRVQDEHRALFGQHFGGHEENFAVMYAIPDLGSFVFEDPNTIAYDPDAPIPPIVERTTSVDFSPARSRSFRVSRPTSRGFNAMSQSRNDADEEFNSSSIDRNSFSNMNLSEGLRLALGLQPSGKTDEDSNFKPWVPPAQHGLEFSPPIISNMGEYFRGFEYAASADEADGNMTGEVGQLEEGSHHTLDEFPAEVPVKLASRNPSFSVNNVRTSSLNASPSGSKKQLSAAPSPKAVSRKQSLERSNLAEGSPASSRKQSIGKNSFSSPLPEHEVADSTEAKGAVDNSIPKNEFEAPILLSVPIPVVRRRESEAFTNNLFSNLNLNNFQDAQYKPGGKSYNPVLAAVMALANTPLELEEVKSVPEIKPEVATDAVVNDNEFEVDFDEKEHVVAKKDGKPASGTSTRKSSANVVVAAEEQNDAVFDVDFDADVEKEEVKERKHSTVSNSSVKSDRNAEVKAETPVQSPAPSNQKRLSTPKSDRRSAKQQPSPPSASSAANTPKSDRATSKKQPSPATAQAETSPKVEQKKQPPAASTPQVPVAEDPLPTNSVDNLPSSASNSVAQYDSENDSLASKNRKRKKKAANRSDDEEQFSQLHDHAEHLSNSSGLEEYMGMQQNKASSKAPVVQPVMEDQGDAEDSFLEETAANANYIAAQERFHSPRPGSKNKMSRDNTKTVYGHLTPDYSMFKQAESTYSPTKESEGINLKQIVGAEEVTPSEGTTKRKKKNSIASASSATSGENMNSRTGSRGSSRPVSSGADTLLTMEYNTLKKELKKWKSEFVAENNREPTIADFNDLDHTLKVKIARKNQLKKILDTQAANARRGSKRPTSGGSDVIEE